MSQRRRMIVEDDDDEEEYSSRAGSGSKRAAAATAESSQKRRAVVDDNDAEFGSAPKQILPEDFERMVKDVVRLALFTSYSDNALKRDDIRPILGNHGRVFDKVFEKAQERLRQVFGMEMVELMTRTKVGPANPKGTSSTGSKTYILRSTLPVKLLSTTVVDWESSNEEMGFIMVVLSLIFVRQGAVSESTLLSHMKRLAPEAGGWIESEVPTMLESGIKKRYLEKTKLAHLDEGGEKAAVEFRWGSRAKAEISDDFMVQFMKEIFGSDAPKNLETNIKKAAGIDTKGKEVAENGEGRS